MGGGQAQKERPAPEGQGITGTRQNQRFCRMLFSGKTATLCQEGIAGSFQNCYTERKDSLWGEKRGWIPVKRRVLSLLAALVLMLGLIPTASAAQPDLVITMRYNSPWCVIGDTVTQIDETSSAVVLMAESGRTMLPIRRMIEAFGGTVEWVQETNGVRCSLNGTSVKLELDSTTALVNGEEVTMDVPMRARNNRTFVPVRFVSENLGLTVEWEGTNQIVVVANGEVDKNSLTSLPRSRSWWKRPPPRRTP